MRESTNITTEDTAPALYCAYHPNRETLLRCNRCEKPICTDCAIRTPVGFRCRDCVRGQQAVYFTAGPADLPIAAAVALVLGAAAGALAYLLLGSLRLFGFLLAFFVGPMIGGLIAEGVRRSVGKRRGRYLKPVAAIAALAGIVVGGLFVLFVPTLLAGAPLGLFFATLPRLLLRWDVLLFAVLAASTIYARLV